jgi:hypothetical protein
MIRIAAACLRRTSAPLAAAALALAPCAAAAGSLTTLYTFAGGADGQNPVGGVVLGPSGALFGSTYYGGFYSDHFQPGGGTLFELTAPASGHGAWRKTILVNFFGPTQGQKCSQPLLADRGVAGFAPQSPPTFDPFGNIYAAASQSGCDEGTIVELSPKSTGFAIAHVLQFQKGYPTRKDTRGNDPSDWGGLVYDPAGNVYGTTVGDGPHMLGEVFRLAPGLAGNVVTILEGFLKSDILGDGPVTGVVFGAGGVLYGTTSGTFLGHSTVFQLDPTGGATVLHTFTSATGIDPTSLVLHGGALYGTTADGGTLPGGGGGQGVVFELAPPATGSKWTYTVLHTFGEGADGAHPSSLLFGASGAIYGNAKNGGPAGTLGVIFELAPPASAGAAWTETFPWTFAQGTDGAEPIGNLAMDSAGTIYGATEGDGAGPAPYGTVFKLVP